MKRRSDSHADDDACVTITEEITGHFCRKCELLVSLSLNA
jgi:hypothetical protein